MHSDVNSPATTNSGDMTLTNKHLLTVAPQSDNPMEGGASLLLDSAVEMELETAVDIPLDGPICIEQYMRFFFCRKRCGRFAVCLMFSKV